MKNLMKLFILSALVSATMFAQTIASTTTLGAAITTTSQGNPYTTITLSSTSGMLAAGTQNQYNTVLYIDQELLGVISLPTSTTATVKRGLGLGIGSKPTTHANGATVFYFNTANTTTTQPTYAASYITTNGGPENWGSCTSSAQIALPRINSFWGTKSDCIGGQWVRTDAPEYPSLATGVTVPAGVLTATGTIMITDTGTNAMTGITVPNGWAPGMCLTFVPGGAFTWTTATNIAASGTAVVNKTLLACWDGAKWAMSE